MDAPSIKNDRGTPVPITRIDFAITSRVVAVIKFTDGDYLRGDTVVSREIHPQPFDVEAAISWCERHGYIVRRYPGGARAFYQELFPIRDTYAIRVIRARLERTPHPELGPLGGYTRSIDLRYDL